MHASIYNRRRNISMGLSAFPDIQMDYLLELRDYSRASNFQTSFTAVSLSTAALTGQHLVQKLPQSIDGFKNKELFPCLFT